MEEFKDRLLTVMKERKLTKYKIAHELQFSKSTFTNYLSGRSIPKSKKLTALCDFLVINPLWLLTGTGPKDLVIEPEISDYEKNTLESFEILSLIIKQWKEELRQQKEGEVLLNQKNKKQENEIIVLHKENKDLRTLNLKLSKENEKLKKEIQKLKGN